MKTNNFIEKQLTPQKPHSKKARKADKRSDHKHKYEPCIIIYPHTHSCMLGYFTSISSYCVDCGKISHSSRFVSEEVWSESLKKPVKRLFLGGTIDEIKKFVQQKPDLMNYPIFKIQDAFQKTVDISSKL